MSIDEFFTAIKNGEWHSVDDLSGQLGIPPSKLDELSKFLFKRGLIKYEEKTRKIRIQPLWKLLLPEEEPVEQETVVATFILPPKTSIDVQSTHISNISNVEVEVSLRISSKIKEVAIAV